MTTRKLSKGEPVEIIETGKRGLLRRVVKSSGLYEVEFYPYASRKTEANRMIVIPSNVRAVNDGAVGV